MNPTDALGWTLIHFVWQGALIAALAALATAGLRTASAKTRYAAACGAMLLMPLCALATFSLLSSGSRTGDTVTLAAAVAAAPPVVASAARGIASVPAVDYLPFVVYFWFAGALLQANLIPFGRVTLGLDPAQMSYTQVALAMGIGVGAVLAGRTPQV